jgi:hypothetical protein
MPQCIEREPEPECLDYDDYYGECLEYAGDDEYDDMWVQDENCEDFDWDNMECLDEEPEDEEESLPYCDELEMEDDGEAAEEDSLIRMFLKFF